jgi:hypothetical protein
MLGTCASGSVCIIHCAPHVSLRSLIRLHSAHVHAKLSHLYQMDYWTVPFVSSAKCVRCARVQCHLTAKFLRGISSLTLTERVTRNLVDCRCHCVRRWRRLPLPTRPWMSLRMTPVPHSIVALVTALADGYLARDICAPTSPMGVLHETFVHRWVSSFVHQCLASTIGVLANSEWILEEHQFCKSSLKARCRIVCGPESSLVMKKVIVRLSSSWQLAR